MNDDKTTPWQLLHEYMTLMQYSVGLWEDFFSSQTIDWLFPNEIQEWLLQIKSSLSILESLHAYDDMASLKIGLQSSGFPDGKYLNEILSLSKLPINEEENIESLKRVFLDNLFSTCGVNYPLLEKISKIQATKMIHESKFLRPFEMTSFREIKSKNGRRAYICSWNCYIIQSMPVKYVMLFEASDPWFPTEDNLSVLKKILQEETSIIFTLVDIAKSLDRSNAKLHPKWIGRIILGPVIVSNMTRDNHYLQKILDDQTKDGEFLITSGIIYEYLVAGDEEKVTSLIDPQGELHSCMQRYAVTSFDGYGERGVTHCEKHQFIPHQVMQIIGHRRKDDE